jgi:1-acyl-sn-glycerol-3-phosphate acyltransferase
MIKNILAQYFKLTGWTFVNKIPPELRSFVVLGAPHTSNHDFMPGMAVCHFMGRAPHFVIKDDWLKFPMNYVLGPMGAIGIDRRRPQGPGHKSYTEVMAELFKKIPELVLMIAPEATRSPNGKWKTGFYYIAQKANVPIVLGYADYAKKEAGLGMAILPTDFDKDMRTIMEFYRDIKGRRPENFKLDETFR